jgi:uncharacterized protein
MLRLREKDGGVTIECRVIPRAGRTEIRGEREGVLQIALNVPPIEGRANEALIQLLAKAFRVPPSRISILKGLQSRTKVLFVHGVKGEEAHQLLSAVID